MPSKTSIYELPYPLDADAPDGPTQIKALTDRVETVLGMGLRVYPPKVISSTQERTENTYATLGTADEIPNLIVPTGGLVIVDYSAIVECTKLEKGRAAIFFGSNQLKVASGASVTGATEAAVFGASTENVGQRLTTFPGGLIANKGNASTFAGFDVSTGLAGGVVIEEGSASVEIGGTLRSIANAATLSAVFGGLLIVRSLSAGTYNLSVRFKTSEGMLAAKQRRLWAAVAGIGV